MKLHLKKPIAFFDLETTGINVATDRIVEISILKVNPDGSQEIKTRKINPTIPIPLEASLVHGIYDKDIQDEPTFSAVAKSLRGFFENCDLAGFNSNRFDVPLLMEEFLRAGVDFEIDNRNLVDIQNIFHQMEQRTLSAGYKFYCGKDLINAHSAEADTIATFEILESMLDKYKDSSFEKEDGSSYNPVTNDMDQLGEFSKRANNVDLMGRIVLDENNVAVFNFGKYKGTPVAEVLNQNPGYYSWMMNGDFPLYTKKVLEKIKLEILQDKLNSK